MGCRGTGERDDSCNGNDTYVPSEMIPRCSHCGGEAFPWVRGYGNFLQGEKYEGEYQKIIRLYSEKQGQEDIVLRAWGGKDDTDVYSGTFLEPDTFPVSCAIYCCE